MKPRRLHRRSYNVPGHGHELTFSCYGGFPFLQRDRTCEWLVESLNAARTALDFDLWAFVFMPEHVHLIVRPRRPVYDVDDILQAIKEPVGRKAIAWLRKHAPQWLPRVAVSKGARARYRFWQQGGGYDRNIVEPRALLEMIEYIHMNPVRRGLVEQASQWKWSSAAWYLNGTECPILLDPIPPEWLLVE